MIKLRPLKESSYTLDDVTPGISAIRPSRLSAEFEEEPLLRQRLEPRPSQRLPQDASDIGQRWEQRVMHQLPQDEPLLQNRWNHRVPQSLSQDEAFQQHRWEHRVSQQLSQDEPLQQHRWEHRVSQQLSQDEPLQPSQWEHRVSQQLSQEEPLLQQPSWDQRVSRQLAQDEAPLQQRLDRRMSRELFTEPQQQQQRQQHHPVLQRRSTASIGKRQSFDVVSTPSFGRGSVWNKSTGLRSAGPAKDARTKEFLLDCISRDRFCQTLDKLDQEDIVEAMEESTHQSGECLAALGVSSGRFMVLHSGALETRANMEGGESVERHQRGATLGAMSLLYDCPRMSEVVVTEPSRVWSVGGKAFRELMREAGQRHYEENRQLLDSIGLFDGLPDRQKGRIAELALVEESFEEGARIITAGEAPAAMYLIKKGQLSIMQGGHVDSCGRLVGGTWCSQLMVGDTFGGRSVLYNEPHRVTVVADEHCELVCIGFQQLKSVIGEDLASCIERSFVQCLLKNLPFFTHLSLSQRQHLLRGMDTRNYKSGEKVEEGFRLIAVLEGEVSGRELGEPVTLQRGGLCVDEELMQLDAQDSQCAQASGGPQAFPTDLQAGPDGARIAALTKRGLTDAFQKMGVTGFVSADAAVEHMRKMLLARKVPIFRQLSEDHIDRLVHAFVLGRYRKGAQVFKQGEMGSTFYVLGSGVANVVKDGKIIRRLEKGTCFGERSLLLNEPRSSTVEVASSEAELWSVDKQSFRDIVPEEMQEELMHQMRLQDKTVTMADLKHVRLIGAGVFGSVRLVEDIRNGTRYALKRIRKRDGEVPPEAQRECELLAEIAEAEHPFILKLVRSFETDGSLYILTELVTGGQLYEQVKGMGSMGRRQAQFYMGSVVLMLEALHERSICYRDLKPENLMLDNQGYIKLVDFGLARKMARSSKTFTIAGTVYYMAPEIIKGKGYGLEVDVWSLGAMMFEFVCGRLPFGREEDPQEDILDAVVHDELKFPSWYRDSEGRELMAGLLTKEPHFRLGAGLGGTSLIKESPFFGSPSECLFDRIIGREMQPPVVPRYEKYSDEHQLLDTVTLSDSEELGSEGKQGKIASAFRRFDLNGDGKITPSELGRVLQRLDGEYYTDSVVSQLLRTMDENHDGFIDYEEFLRWIFTNDARPLRNAVDLDIHY